MRAMVTFYNGPGTKEHFWEVVKSQPKVREKIGSGYEVSRDLELKFEKEFPNQLQKLIEEDPKNIRKGMNSPIKKISVIDLQDGSLKAILEILADENFRSFVIFALQVYSPDAFQSVFGISVPVYAEWLSGDDPPAPPTFKQQFKAMATPQLAMSVTSLLIPVVIAVWILIEARTALREEAKNLGTERTKVVDALVEQNKSVSTSLVGGAKDSTASAKAMQDLVTAQLGKLLEKALTPNSEIASLTSGIKELTTNVTGLKSDVTDLTKRVSKLEQTPPPPPSVSNCIKDVKLIPDCARIQEALYRKTGRPVDSKNPGRPGSDGIGGPETDAAIRAYLRSINEPDANYLTPDQIRRLLSG
ncbi:hypothetical protein SAMN02990966_00727 [Rhodospirillales bacterium URHD0017]|nr:hypothetical protein SAMN02990966_00727 [Rhodospirillales bacterium URHD0017]